MIGTQKTGRLPGIVISAIVAEGLVASANGKPAKLAIVSEDGQILADGPEVAYEALSVAVNLYRQVLQGKGWLRVLSPNLDPDVVKANPDKYFLHRTEWGRHPLIEDIPAPTAAELAEARTPRRPPDN